MKYLKKFNEELEVTTQRQILIDDFEGELSRMESYDLERFSVQKKFTQEQRNKLNLKFGIDTTIFGPRSKMDYPLSFEYGSFGGAKYDFNGDLKKKIFFGKEENQMKFSI